MYNILIPPSNQRTRQPNFSEGEIGAMIDGYESNKTAIEGKDMVRFERNAHRKIFL